jgi:pimeloyl-ACP methyl ester carboxylesterase
LVLYGPKIERVIPGSGGPIDVDLREQFFTSTKLSSDQSFQSQYGEEKALKPWWDEGRKWDAQSPNGVAVDFQTRMPLSDPAKLTIPTLIVLGAGDFMWEEKDSLLRYFGAIASTDKHLALLPNGGHALHLHHGREQFFRRLIDFFES